MTNIKSPDIDVETVSDVAKGRHEQMLLHAPRLSALARRAISRSMQNDQFVVVCIKVHSKWRPLVDKLMPGYDWSQNSEAGIEPFARGTATWGVISYIAEELPDLDEVLREIPLEGRVKCIFLNDTGGTVYEIPIDENYCTPNRISKLN